IPAQSERMPSSSSESLLSELEQHKTLFDHQSARRIERLLHLLAARSFDEIQPLIRFHETLLFLFAHPHDRKTRTLTKKLLDGFELRVARLRRAGADMTTFDYIEYSGIDGTEIRGRFSYDIVLWLASRFGEAVEIAW